MDSPKNIKIPEPWLIDDGIETYWPYAEGIWVSKETEPILRLVAVHHTLMDIPEVKSQLIQCNDQFISEFADEIRSLFKPVMQEARAGKPTNTPQMSEVEIENIYAIYRTWVNDWALGNPKTLEWVIGSNIPEIILNVLRSDFNRQDWRRLQNRLTDFSSKFSPPWVCKTLLSGDYKRLDQTKRELARHTVQNWEYYRKRERTLLKHACYWIMVRVLAIKPDTLLNELTKNSSKEDFKLTTNDLTDRILKPFDDVFDYKRKPGRPTSVAN